MASLVARNPFYAAIYQVLDKPENFQQQIIVNVMRTGVPLGNLLNLKWFGLNKEVQKMSARILKVIRETCPVGYKKIRFLTGHLENPTPLTRLHHLMLRLFRDHFLTDYSEQVSNKQAVYLIKKASSQKWATMDSEKIRDALETMSKQNPRLCNTYLPFASLLNYTTTVEGFMPFIDLTNFSLPTTYEISGKNDPDARRLIESSVQSGGFFDQEYNGLTILHLAAIRGDFSIVSAALDEGASINIPTTVKNEHMPRGTTPLHRVAMALKNSDAVSRELEKMFLFLLEKGARMRVVDGRGQTPFRILFNAKHLTQEFIQKLCNKNPPIADKSPTDRKTPLQYLLANYPSLDFMPWLRLYVKQGGKDGSVRSDFFKHLAGRTDGTRDAIKEFSSIFDNKRSWEDDVVYKENVEDYPPRKKQKTER